MPFLIAVLSLLALQDDAPRTGKRENVPEVLAQAILQRMHFKTARFEVRYEERPDPTHTWTSNLSYEWAGESQFITNRGDDDGVRYVSRTTGQVPLGVSHVAMPEQIVLNRSADVMWSHALASGVFGQRRADHWPDYVDARTYGLMPIEHQKSDPLQLLELLGEGSDVRFQDERIAPNLVRVRRSESDADGSGLWEIEWEIDVDKGPAVTQVSSYYTRPGGGRALASRAVNDLVLIDGVWWPSSVKSTRGDTPVTVSYRNVEFDRATHRQAIDADALDIPVGAMVNKLSASGQPEFAHYIGAGVTVSVDEWRRIEGGYDLKPLQEFAKRINAMGSGGFPGWWDAASDTNGIEGVADNPDLWETYVRRWTLRHTNNGEWVVVEPLTDEQRAGARSVLDDCRKRAVPIRMRADQELATVAKNILAIEKDSGVDSRAVGPNGPTPKATTTSAPAVGMQTQSEPVAPDRAAQKSKSPDSAASGDTPKPAPEVVARLTSLRERKASLESPLEIRRIFDELKQRLDNLLTSKQRDPAGGSIRRLPFPKRQPPPGMRPSAKNP